MRHLWHGGLVAVILFSALCCRRPSEEEHPDLGVMEVPSAKEFAIHVRDSIKPERIASQPFRGSETVLDALTMLHRENVKLGNFDIWLVRREADGNDVIFRVDWVGITERGETMTNYLLCGGDRLVVQPKVP